jgi:hypothetical protein
VLEKTGCAAEVRTLADLRLKASAARGDRLAKAEREQPSLRADVDAGEGGALAPGLDALRDDRVDTPLLSGRASATVVALDKMKISADFRALAHGGRRHDYIQPGADHRQPGARLDLII